MRSKHIKQMKIQMNLNLHCNCITNVKLNLPVICSIKINRIKEFINTQIYISHLLINKKKTIPIGKWCPLKWTKQIQLYDGFIIVVKIKTEKNSNTVVKRIQFLFFLWFFIVNTLKLWMYTKGVNYPWDLIIQVRHTHSYVKYR